MSMLLTEEGLGMEDVYCVNVHDDQVFTQVWLQECIGTAGQQLSTVKERLRLPLSKKRPTSGFAPDLDRSSCGCTVGLQRAQGVQPNRPPFPGLGTAGWVPFLSSRFAIPAGMTAR